MELPATFLGQDGTGKNYGHDPPVGDSDENFYFLALGGRKWQQDLQRIHVFCAQLDRSSAHDEPSDESLPVRAQEFITEKWSEKYKRSINCAHPRGFSQRAHCQGRRKKTDEDEQLDELTFKGSKCTVDCSGHRAGYEWYKRKGRAPNSWSPSFNNGAAIAAAGK